MPFVEGSAPWRDHRAGSLQATRRKEALASIAVRAEAARRAKWPAHNRNGGRHCCQPPLRRAKDLPVFVNLVRSRKRSVTPLSILAHQLRRRFPPSRSLLRGARLIYSTARPEGSLVFRPFRPGFWNRSPSKPKPPDVPRPFLGNHSSRPALLIPHPKNFREPRRARGRSTLPAPLPGWPRYEPESSSHCLPAEIGPLVTCRTLLAVAGLPGRPGPPSRSPDAPCTSLSESRKQKFR